MGYNDRTIKKFAHSPWSYRSNTYTDNAAVQRQELLQKTAFGIP